MENVSIFALGGQDENGKNSYVLEYNKDIYVINCGVKIPINSHNGVDTLIPNFSYLEKYKDDIKGVFITDIKNESFSALPWLVMKIPGVKIYTSAFNKVFIQERLNKYKINNNDYKIEVIDTKKQIGSLKVVPIKLTGCIPGNLGFNFQTKTGDYLFMFNYVEGDLGIFGKTSFNEIANQFKNRKINAFVSDAGKSNYSGKAIDKLNKYQQVKTAFETTSEDARIIVGAYDEEMVALEHVLRFAIQYNRPLITYGKTYAQILYLISKLHPELGLPQIIDYKFINKHKNAVVLVTGSIERLYTRFLRITDNNDVYLKLNANDTVIMLAPPVNGLESMSSLSLDEIARIAPKLYDISDQEFFIVRPTKQDLLDAVNALKPKTFIPTQGLYRYLVDAANFIEENIDDKKEITNVILLNGKIARYTDGNLVSTSDKIKDVSDTIIDGFGIGDISSEVIAERESLGREGVIIINALYSSKTKQLVGKLHVNYVGVIDEADQDRITTLIKKVIIEIMDEGKFTSMREINERLRKTIRKRIFKLTDKDPMIALTITNN
ncbi:ribonuclease J [Mycoplasma corogypsi]|uniref:ribonuclease J n=1 Tax=Mycoplasma corogypsi TaxID=2106 RepID=UPI003873936B